MTRPKETRPPTIVPFAATPAGEPPPVRAWANPSVWTDSMLTALEKGVRGGRWHTLIDKVSAEIKTSETAPRKLDPCEDELVRKKIDSEQLGLGFLKKG